MSICSSLGLLFCLFSLIDVFEAFPFLILENSFLLIILIVLPSPVLP